MTLPANYIIRQPSGTLWLLTDSTVRQDMPSLTPVEVSRLRGVQADHFEAILLVKRVLGGRIEEARKCQA